jgi:two-component system response regulator AtoC
MVPEAMSRLLEYSWPGNVRELENSIERAMVIADDSLLLPEHFPTQIIDNNGSEPSGNFNGFSLKDAQKIMEKKFITRALEETEGNRTRASKLLEISHPSLLTKIKAYNIDL